MQKGNWFKGHNRLSIQLNNNNNLPPSPRLAVFPSRGPLIKIKRLPCGGHPENLVLKHRTRPKESRNSTTRTLPTATLSAVRIAANLPSSLELPGPFSEVPPLHSSPPTLPLPLLSSFFLSSPSLPHSYISPPPKIH